MGAVGGSNSSLNHVKVKERELRETFWHCQPCGFKFLVLSLGIFTCNDCNSKRYVSLPFSLGWCVDGWLCFLMGLVICYLVLDELFIFQRGFRSSMSRNNSAFSKIRSCPWARAMGPSRTSSGCGLRTQSSFTWSLHCAWASPTPLVALPDQPSLSTAPRPPDGLAMRRQGSLRWKMPLSFSRNKAPRQWSKRAGNTSIAGWKEMSTRRENQSMKASA